MPAAVRGGYPRTAAVAAALLLALSFGYSGLRDAAYAGLYPFFEWMETTWFGVIGKTWGAAFAFVEAVHLLGLAVLGGCVIAGDGRLLGLVFRHVPARTVVERAHRLFVPALGVMLFTGVFMACGVALKIYYLPVYWFKMLALASGMLFHFLVRRPLLRHDPDDINPAVRKLVAAASLLVWFMVAATGRWIGFSG